MTSLTVTSLFAGIGGFDLGFEQAGMTTVQQVEYDDRARAVLEARFPQADRSVTDVRSLTDTTTDVVCGGFPCQDVSVAGRRAGLDGERSGLWFEFHRLLKRNQPRWVVIENVPGLLSSNGGRDMGTVIGGLADCGYGWAYAVLDSQYFGVAQRRRRVFIVGCLGDRGNPIQVLFEPESGAGHPPPSREAGERTAGAAALGAHPGGFNGQDAYTGNYAIDNRNLTVDPDVTHTLQAKANGGYSLNYMRTVMAWHGAQITSPQNRGGVFYGISPTLNSVPRAMVGVRRLTPVECERLQGFPDGWTDVPGTSDTQRYKQLGNAVTVNVARWIGQRIVAVERGEDYD